MAEDRIDLQYVVAAISVHCTSKSKDRTYVCSCNNQCTDYRYVAEDLPLLLQQAVYTEWM